MVNHYRTSNISNPLIFQFLNSLFRIPHSAFRNQKRLHSLPLVVIFPVAFAYSSAADGQYPDGVTFGQYGGV